MNKNAVFPICIHYANIKKSIFRMNVKNTCLGGDIMNNYVMQEKLQNELIEKFNKDTSKFEKLIDKIKAIINFDFIIDEVEVSDDIEDSDIKINISDAFTEDEIKDYNLLKLKFDEKLKEFAFIKNIYKSQKKCANSNFDLELAIKIKKMIDLADAQIESEKKAICGVNRIINEKEKKFATKLKELKSVLTTMKRENNIDDRKLSLLFGDEFIDLYKVNLMSCAMVEFLKNNTDYTFGKAIEDSNYLRSIVNKYPSLKKKVEYDLGTNS